MSEGPKNVVSPLLLAKMQRMAELHAIKMRKRRELEARRGRSKRKRMEARERANGRVPVVRL